MFNHGYVTFEGIECIYIIEKGRINLIPTHEEDLRKLFTHSEKQHFLFRFSDGIDKNCIAFIERVEMNLGFSLYLYPQYVFTMMNTGPITTMQITGDAIDEIFHPSNYYYMKYRSGIENNVDLTNSVEIADKWTFVMDGQEICVALQYGGILYRGIASEARLRPQLIMTFVPTTDTAFLFKMYSVVTRFLQLAQYNSNYGECTVELSSNSIGKNTGYLWDCTGIGGKRNFYSEVRYRSIKPYISKLLQFSADNLNISVDCLPKNKYRWSRIDYTSQDVDALFAAFESEYKANKQLFESEPEEDLNRIKELTLQKIGECSTDDISEVEKKFLSQVKKSIKSIGIQTGQKTKIKNVLHVLNTVLKTSAENLFVQGRIGTEEGFSEDEISKISKTIVGLRSRASHDNSLIVFDDLQAEHIHFLEILVYALMLIRAGINDEGIEVVLGLVFHCNHRYMDILLEDNDSRM